MQQAIDSDPFALFSHLKSPAIRKVAAKLEAPVHRALGTHALRQLYARATTSLEGSFPDRALTTLGVNFDVDDAELARIPRQGGLIIVANHPFGGLEGLVLASLLGKLRNDVRLLANHLLGRIPEMRPHLIAVDPFGGRSAARRNLAGMRQALQWLDDGGVLVVFPSGTVSHWQMRRGGVTDPQWQDGAARLARLAQVPVVPLYFSGRNSLSFQVAGTVHPLLRTLLLPSQLVNRCNSRVRIRVGTPVRANRVTGFANAAELTAYLRFRTYLLGCRLKTGTAKDQATAHALPIAAATQPDAGIDDLLALPPQQHLLDKGPWRVSWCRAAQMPTLLPEIGRLREVSFRAVGEGSGLAQDLDEFDPHYRHIVVWHADDRRVVGAYRAGCSDELMAAAGPGGFYSSTLFRMRAEFFQQLPPAIELGRSFVRPEYQRHYQPLLLLWQGIGHLLAAEPHYRILFGPVSVSSRYGHHAMEVIRRFLERHRNDAELGRHVRPRHPLQR